MGVGRMTDYEMLSAAHEIDHRNGNPSDNRWDNLREATSAQNKANRTRPTTNKTGFKGVSFNERSRRFCAHISIGNKTVFLGSFATAEEAHAAYVAKARDIFGEFAMVA